MTEPTPQQVLALPMQSEIAGVATIGDYLIRLLADLWRQGSDFNAKRPFGGADWQWIVYEELVRAGWVAGRLDDDGCAEDVDVPSADRLIVSAIKALQGNEDSALRFKPLPGGSYVVAKSGLHHFGCTPDSGMHHEDDCPRGFRTELGAALENGPVPIELIGGAAAGVVVHGGEVKVVDGEPPTTIATAFWTEGL